MTKYVKKFEAMDGNTAAAHTAYAFTEVAGIYPITPSSDMAEKVDLWSSQGKKNLFGDTVNVVEMQSEAGAAGTVHGSLQAGALTTTFTASQGLLLKVPNMYKIAGELLPGVIHVSARSIAAQALSIFGDHQDIYNARTTGFAMLGSGSVQQVMDLGGIAHLAAIEGRVPFVHFFDGFRTSHEIQKVEVLDYQVYEDLLDYDAVTRFRTNSLNPEHPVLRGTAQNDDIYFQTREVSNKFYDAVPDIVNKYMKKISEVTGREYAPFQFYGAKDATDIIICMGSFTEAIKETVDYLVAAGQKVGLLQVHLFRPFSEKYFFDALPESVERICVLDRTKEPGAAGEPLFLDVVSMFNNKERSPFIIGGRYGLSSKDSTPAQVVAVFNNLKSENPKNGFTVGINDDVTHLSIDVPKFTLDNDGVTECLFFGLGSDGTVGATKNSAKIIGENTDLYGQVYSSYDSKKSGGVTRMHLRFGQEPIRSTYLVSNPHFVSCSRDAYLEKYDMVNGLRENGTFLLNTITSKEEVEAMLPNHVKRALAEKKAKFYIIDAVTLAREIGLGNRTNTIMQSAFFKLNEQIMGYEKAVQLMKDYAEKLYGRKGQEIVDLNWKAIEVGASGLIEMTVNPEWANLEGDLQLTSEGRPEFVKNIVDPVNNIKGYDLPVSAFLGYEDGSFEAGTTAYEKRGVADFVPHWVEDNCIQCNQCAYVCPHAVVRPFLLTEEEVNNAPAELRTLKPIGKGTDGLQYTLSISPLDCTGCEVCVNVCPGKKGNKALEMVPLSQEIKANEQEVANYTFNKVDIKTDVFGLQTVKGTQFAQPLFEFSGACAGCGETPYIKLITQLYGDRMLVANATGCSSIYGGSAPVSPYTKDKNGHGPGWANSLFEDNAEFGYGMAVASESIRNRIHRLMEEGMETASSDIKELFTKWIENKNSGDITKEVKNALVPLLQASDADFAKEILKYTDQIVKKSVWAFGGDGWAYDIGYGGLDHVMANSMDINILVVDTEVYSNTGGQSSKASPTGSIAKFTAAGKEGKKKDLAAIAMTYGHVYVAQVSMGASHAQFLKALREAEAYDGPSIVIAYAPCIAHGIKGGMGNASAQMKFAVDAGYWMNFRFNPTLINEGKNPLVVDSKEPKWDLYKDFLLSEKRYSALNIVNPDKIDQLLETNVKEAKRRYNYYKRMEALEY